MSGTTVCPTCGATVDDDARFCATCGSALGEQAPEERKLATILFADVIGSTDLGEQLDPERLRALLQDYFGAMSAVVDTWGGTIEKYIGDAILAVWGVPAAREDDPVRALHAAREMLSELARINPDLEQRHGIRLGLRIGVNTGEVLAPVGAQPAGQFLVSGDAVNVAARLEQSAQPDTVLVGERTWAGARGAFEFGEPIALDVRGKRDAVAARRLGEPLAADALEATRSLQAPMLGRERELNTLIGLLDEAVEERKPRLVLISGPAGIGKSRLLRELTGQAGERVPDISILRGRCLSTGRGITFWPLGEILRQLCAISLDETGESAAEKLGQRTAGTLAAVGLSQDEIRDTVAALAVSAGLRLADNPLDQVDPDDVAERMTRAWPRLLTGLAIGRPLAVLIEDIHWADEPMLRMIETLASRSAGRILIVATARPEFIEANAGFGAGADLSIVALRPLTDVQSERLIAALLGSAQLPHSLVEEIQRKADGNPFFVEELVQRLIDEGALVERDGQWLATDKAAAVRLPDTIHALLASRIDALPADEKRLLQEAAVVGRIFWPGALPDSNGETADLLRRLERRGLIAARPTSTIENEPEYMFRHVLIRDVAYASVPKRRRARAHAETGRWIETLAGSRLDEVAELVAYHYAAAAGGEDADLGWTGDPAGREAVRRRAFELLIRAADSARRRFALDRAIELHSQALELAATDEERAIAHEELGDDSEALYHGDTAVREYLAAYDLTRAPELAHRIAEQPTEGVGDPGVERRGRLAGKAGRMILRWGTFQDDPPFERVQEIVSAGLASEVSDHVLATLLMVNGGLMRSPSGAPIAAGRMPVRREQSSEISERIDSIERGLALARKLDDVELLYLGSDMLVTAYQIAGDYSHMREAAEQQGEIVDRLNSVRHQVDSLVTLASVRTATGAYGDALEAAEDGYRRSVGLSAHERMHVAYEIFDASEASGQWDRISELAPWFADAANAEGGITCASVRAGPAFGATILARRGEVDQALALVPLDADPLPEATFVAAAHKSNYASLVGPPDFARDLVRMGLAQTGAGFFELGIGAMLEAMARLEMIDELHGFLEEARTQIGSVVTIAPAITRAEAVIALAEGDRSSAQATLRSALARFEELGAPFQIAQTQELLAGVVDERERHDLLSAAAAIYESLGAAPFAAGAHDALAAGGERLSR